MKTTFLILALSFLVFGCENTFHTNTTAPAADQGSNPPTTGGSSGGGSGITNPSQLFRYSYNSLEQFDMTTGLPTEIYNHGTANLYEIYITGLKKMLLNNTSGMMQEKFLFLITTL